MVGLWSGLTSVRHTSTFYFLHGTMYIHQLRQLRIIYNFWQVSKVSIWWVYNQWYTHDKSGWCFHYISFSHDDDFQMMNVFFRGKPLSGLSQVYSQLQNQWRDQFPKATSLAPVRCPFDFQASSLSRCGLLATKTSISHPEFQFAPICVLGQIKSNSIFQHVQLNRQTWYVQMLEFE
jgi:hypothetical protein